jgi:LPS-assembly protein
MTLPLKPILSRAVAASLMLGVVPGAPAAECPQPVVPEAEAGLPPGEAAVPDEEQLIHLESDGASVARTGDAALLGNVRVVQGTRTLRAETATYDAATGRFKVEGDVEYQDPQLRVKGSTGTWSGTEGGRFEGAEFELPARPARGSAGELGLTAQGNLELQDVLFTTCPAGDDDWLLKASSIEIDREAQQGTGRDVRLEFLGVPILYAPWISFPAGDRRKSGFLFPTIGTSTSNGFEFGIPYYFNLASNYDATLEPSWFSKRGVELSGNFRYLTERSRGRLDGRYLPNDQQADRDRGYARLRHLTDLTDVLRLSAQLEDASDSRYFEDFARGPEGTSITHLERRIDMQYLGSGWRAIALLQNFQTIDTAIAPLDRPYARAPQLFAEGDWQLGPGPLIAGFDSELVYFYRDEGVTGARAQVAPRVSIPLRAPGWFIVPSATYRHVAYSLSDTEPGADDSPSFGAPTLALDAGLAFDRSTGRRGTLTQTLEPRMLYSWTPYRDQDGLPVFDTGLPELDMVRLFSLQRYVGGDRISDANRIAAGVTTRLIDSASGRQYLTATIGQQYFLDTPRVSLPEEASDTRGRSDVIAELGLSAYRDWSVELAMQWDPDSSNTVLGQAAVQYRPAPDTLVNVGYRYRDSRVEQWETSAAWRISSAWSVFGRYVYSVRDQQTIDSFAGVEYEACCWRLRLVGSRYLSNRTGEQSTSVALQLELKGLSSVGTTSDTFLERGIRGYSRDPGNLP